MACKICTNIFQQPAQSGTPNYRAETILTFISLVVPDRSQLTRSFLKNSARELPQVDPRVGWILRNIVPSTYSALIPVPGASTQSPTPYTTKTGYILNLKGLPTQESN